MSLTCPTYTGLCEAPALPLRYVWDDTRASRDFAPVETGWLLDAADACSLRARMVLCVGLYEWVMWRFAPLHDDPIPRQVSEAAWCGTVDPRCITFFELTREEWLGPIRGPLWCAITWLRPAVAEGDVRLGEVADALQYLTRLALHVLPEPARLERWLRATLARLAKLFPALLDDPFEDLFDREVGRRRGPLIGREALNPAVDYTPAMGRAGTAALFAQVDASSNPFLASRDEMERAGFNGLQHAARPGGAAPR